MCNALFSSPAEGPGPPPAVPKLPDGAEKGNCRSCNAPVLWIRSASSGKLVPIDATPEYRYFLTREGWTYAHGYTNHFATCPNAKQHRKS